MLFNFDSYEQYCKLEPLQLNKSRSNTDVVNGEKLKLIGYTSSDATFGTSTDYPINIKAAISAQNGSDLNNLELDFTSQTIKSIKFPKFKLHFKNTQI